MSRNPFAPESKRVRCSRPPIFDLTAPPDLRAAAALMRQYADTPTDFADATLMLLAEGLALTEIIALDWRGFSTYRTSRGRALRMVLDSA